MVACVPSLCLPESVYLIFSKDLRGASIVITYHCLFTNAIPDFESSHFKDDSCPCSCEYSFQNLGFEEEKITYVLLQM